MSEQQPVSSTCTGQMINLPIKILKHEIVELAHFRILCSASEMVQWVRALAVLLKILSSICSNEIVAGSQLFITGYDALF